MNRKFLFITMAVSVGALALIAAGCEMCCNSSQGAGSLVITDPVTSKSHRATFNYRVSCARSNDPGAAPTVAGRIQYQDHGSWTNADGVAYNVSLEAAIDDVVSTEQAYLVAAGDDYYNFQPVQNSIATQDGAVCSTNTKIAIFKGTYKPRQQAGEAGIIYVMVMDNGKGGPSSDDRFEILLDTGVFKGYRQRGVLAGGNIRAN